VHAACFAGGGQLLPSRSTAALPCPPPPVQTDATGAIVVHKGGEPLTDFEKGVDGTLAEIAKENTSLFSGLTCVPLLLCAGPPARAPGFLRAACCSTPAPAPLYVQPRGD